jgi:surfactin synthase thioesterase subunit
MIKPNIFLLHYAGGSSYSFQFLQPLLNSFNVYTPELPGRGKRTRETILSDPQAAVNHLFNEVKSVIQPGKDIIFGHSMGALLAFHVTNALERIGAAPKHLVVSGNSGPQEGSTRKMIYKLNNQAFKEELKSIGGVSDEFLENEDLYEFYEPILRSDFKLSYDLSSLNDIVIQTPICAFMGTEETMYHDIENWRRFTRGTFSHMGFKGGHFFLHDHAEKISASLTQYALS